MRKLTFTSATILLLALSVGCGGDEERPKGALTPRLTEQPKTETPPAGQAAPRVGAPGPQPCGEVFDAAWVQSPRTFREAVQMASTVVEAEVSAVAPGEDLVTPAAQEPGGEYRIPTLRTTVRVARTHKGQAAVGQTLTLFQTGSTCRTMKGDPPYRVGERQLLLLSAGPRDQLTTFSPEGRFRQAADGTLEPTVDTPATREVRGKRISDVEGQIREAAQLPPITLPVPPARP